MSQMINRDNIINGNDVEIDVSYDDTGRIYHTPVGKYYSVTTILGATADKGFLDVWKERIGIKEANHLTAIAANTGTMFHELGEAFLLGKDEPDSQWFTKHLFDKIKPELKQYITKVHGVEVPLYSVIAKVAGRADAVIDWNGELSIFDFKCIGHLNPKFMEDYFIQCALYAHCWHQMYGVLPKNIILCCADKKTLKVKTFKRDTKDYAAQAVDKVQQFHAMNK